MVLSCLFLTPCSRPVPGPQEEAWPRLLPPGVTVAGADNGAGPAANGSETVVVSAELMDLLRGMLRFDPAKRLSMHDIKRHAFYKQVGGGGAGRAEGVQRPRSHTAIWRAACPSSACRRLGPAGMRRAARSPRLTA